MSIHSAAWAALDAMEGDLEHIGSTILNVADGSLLDDLDERIESFDERLLILNSVNLADEWRGFGIGALLAGAALEAMSPGARLAATYPMPLDDATGDTRRAAAEKLGKVWAQIGFEPYRNGVWVADFGRVEFTRGLAELRVRFGLPR